MRTQQQIRQVVRALAKWDAACPVENHIKYGYSGCADCGHAIIGTYIAVLNYVLGDKRGLDLDEYLTKPLRVLPYKGKDGVRR